MKPGHLQPIYQMLDIERVIALYLYNLSSDIDADSQVISVIRNTLARSSTRQREHPDTASHSLSDIHRCLGIRPNGPSCSV